MTRLEPRKAAAGEETLARRYRPGPITPRKVIRLCNGEDLAGPYAWLDDSRYDDPRSAFRAVDGMLHVSGAGWRGLATDHNYRDDRLKLACKWDESTR